MANFFPPTSVYPKNYDSDSTLYLVFNTSESITTSENLPWADEVYIKPVGADQNEIWAENGFANIDGELFYYDSVEKNNDDKIYLLKRCARNLGGTHTKNNPAGAEVRGYVVAEHHNQLVDAILKIENFIGENFTSDESTLDWRIRHLESLPVIFDDFSCPNISFDFFVISDDLASGITAQYNITIDGTFTSYRLDFGDGEFTTTSTSGTHRYAVNTTIDPIVTVSNTRCTMVQTPIARDVATEPQQQTPTTAFEIKIPSLPVLPPFISPTIPIPSNPFIPPPIVFPCLDIGSIGSVGTIPSIINIVPPIDIPSEIVIHPLPNIPSLITISSVNIPTLISFSPVSIPTLITFGLLPSIPTLISFGPLPSIPTLISFGSFPSFPTMITFGSFPSFPTMINFGSFPSFPTMITFGSFPSFPTMINFGPFPSIPTMINFGSFPSFPTEITFGPAPSFPTIISFGSFPSFPTMINFGSFPSFPTMITFGPVPTFPTMINFGPAPSFPSEINFGPAPSFPSEINFGPAPSFPSEINFGPAPSFPSEITFGPAPSFPTMITFGPAPSFPTIQFGTPPSIPIDWSGAPTLSCVVSVDCPGGGSSLRQNNFSSSYTANEIDPISVEMKDLGIPSEITITMPEIPDIKVIHNIPQVIYVDAPIIPDIKIIGPLNPIPQTITFIGADKLPSRIELIAIGLPEKITIDHDLPKSIKLEVPEAFPSIKIDASGIPDKIQVVGIPSAIELIGTIPSQIQLLMPEKPEIELVYKGSPIDVKINMDITRLTGEDGTSQCVSIVPCRQS